MIGGDELITDSFTHLAGITPSYANARYACMLSAQCYWHMHHDIGGKFVAYPNNTAMFKPNMVEPVSAEFRFQRLMAGVIGNIIFDHGTRGAAQFLRETPMEKLWQHHSFKYFREMLHPLYHSVIDDNPEQLAMDVLDNILPLWKSSRGLRVVLAKLLTSADGFTATWLQHPHLGDVLRCGSIEIDTRVFDSLRACNDDSRVYDFLP